MSNHIEYGNAENALYTLHTRDQAVEELHLESGEATEPWVLGLWNENGDGVALQGTRCQLLHYLRLATEHVARETNRHAERADVVERYGDSGYALAEIHLDEAEVDLLNDVAEAAASVNDDRTPTLNLEGGHR